MPAGVPLVKTGRLEDLVNDGSVHALGNGWLCAYGQSLDLIQVFGPPYSSPAFYSLRFMPDKEIHIQSDREWGASIWTHTLSQKGIHIAKIQDFVDAELPCLVRKIHSTSPLRFVLAAPPPGGVFRNDSRMVEAGAQGGLLLEAPAGTYIYHVYPFPRPIVHQLAWRGPVEVYPASQGTAFNMTCPAGESILFFTSAGEYPATIQAAEKVLGTPIEALLERTRRHWAGFSSRRTNFDALLPGDLAGRKLLLKAIDSVATLIKAQQSAEGAVLAGHNYHLGYVRDQYGVSRGLLALGHAAEARRILEFYWGVWQRHGRIQNAQAAGVDGVFHIHENDDSEITGYLILQAFDLFEVTGEANFLGTIFPMLAWACAEQKKELAGGMLPFNGDETYIAGGILPRGTINDGSAEATLLFLESGEKLLAWATQHSLWNQAELAENQAILENTHRLYRDNFWREGRLLTNNPARLAGGKVPRFRHGVCERCSDEGTVRGIEWTERSPAGRYLCPRCLARGPYLATSPTIYELLSVSLTPIYFRSSLFILDELRPLVESIARLFEETGRLPSRPDDLHGTTVGYDYGLLLFALAKLKHPLGDRLYDLSLSLLDSAGAWVEYYLDHHPAGTRCRPWESAINIEALIQWALRNNKGRKKDER
jgi:hypothetical protein